jgi:5-methylcytosine-specific restriction endonuclease McrA
VSTRRYRQARAIVLSRATSCWLCGLPFRDPRDPMVCDHYVPTSLGGTDDPSNLRAAHASCNNRRGNRPVHELKLPFTYRPPGTRAARKSRPTVYVRWL